VKCWRFSNKLLVWKHPHSIDLNSNGVKDFNKNNIEMPLQHCQKKLIYINKDHESSAMYLPCT